MGIIDRVRQLLTTSDDSDGSAPPRADQLRDALQEAEEAIRSAVREREVLTRQRARAIVSGDEKAAVRAEEQIASLDREAARARDLRDVLPSQIAVADEREREEAIRAEVADLEAAAARGRELIGQYRKLAPKVVSVLEELHKIDRRLHRAHLRLGEEGVTAPVPPSRELYHRQSPTLPEAAVIPPAEAGAPTWKGRQPSTDWWSPELAEESRQRREEERQRLEATRDDGPPTPSLHVIDPPDRRTPDLLRTTERSEARRQAG
jgi:hypothetical protein